MINAAEPTQKPHKHQHAVQFYGTEASLFATAAKFLGEGLVGEQPAIVIATPEHRVAIEKYLCDRLIDCEEARRRGELLMLDAEDTLSLFMVGDEPNHELFETNMGRLIEQTLAGRTQTTIRAYGEMVDVLWKQGRCKSAIDLEILWNKLALKYRFSLLCGYSMGSFYKQTQHLEEIAALHSEVIAPKVLAFSRKRAQRSAELR
jgi:hypothetical protein